MIGFKKIKEYLKGLMNKLKYSFLEDENRGKILGLLMTDMFIITMPFIFGPWITGIVAFIMGALYAIILCFVLYELFTYKEMKMAPSLMNKYYNGLTTILFIFSWIYAGYITMVVLYIMCDISINARRALKI